MATFTQVAYLGSARIEEPKSENEIQKLLGVLNREKSSAQDCIDVTLTIPNQWDGELKLVDSESGGEVASFRLHRILFCVRGGTDTPEKDCFAFTYAQTLLSSPPPPPGETENPPSSSETETEHPPAPRNTTADDDKPPQLGYQLQAFRCSIPEAVGRVLICFATAFRKIPAEPSAASSNLSAIQQTAQNGPHDGLGSPELDFQFEAFLEIKEEDGKGGFTFCPQEKNCFKLRRSREKKIVVVLQQVSGPKLLIVQKCFGLLLAAGRNVRQSDMHLLDMQSMGRGQVDSVYVIEALWNPNTPHFEVLNTETPRDTRVFITVAADVVLAGIHDPIRFSILTIREPIDRKFSCESISVVFAAVETKGRIFHSHERFWYITRKPVVERYFMTIKKMEEGGENERPGTSGTEFEMESFDSATERERKLNRISLGRSPNKLPAQLVHPADDDESDADEPLLSGSGDVSQECSHEVKEEWNQCIEKWEAAGSRPKELDGLIRGGVPDNIRGQVWQLLSEANVDKELADAYRLLLGKECDQEQVILRDIHRTFPAHHYFKEAGGDGQDNLFKLSKAYALYDEEVGYCQGLSFLAASLLLHMSEEEAFGVLVKIMFDYGLRDLFKLGFEALHLRFYQLDRLIEDYIPDLYSHLFDLNIETHMYASQWFLTLFTAKFPLQMVFHIIDLFLAENMNTIFHISLALLKASKKDLLQLDFEGILKYFRVALPRKFRTDNTAKELIQQAIKIKISHKRLSKYEKEYMAMKQREAEQQDPQERLERENLRYKETVLRLERENDDLAHELVTSKVELRNALDAAEDMIENLQAQTERATRHNKNLEDENKRLSKESEQVKEMCRKELERLENTTERNNSIISNYKQICSDLSLRLEKQQTSHEDEKRFLLVSSKLQQQEAQIRHLELELAQTKLCLVETQCRNQDLTHVLSSTQTELDSAKNTWFRKTISAVKEAGTSSIKIGSNNNSIKKE